MKSELNRRLKNIHSELITLFVKQKGVETRVDIPAGESMIVDEYETPTMRVYKKKNLITVEPSQLFASNSFAWLSDGDSSISDANDKAKTMDESIDPNNDEVMDDFHTTETHEVVHMGDENKKDLEHFKENLMKSLAKEEKTSRLDIVEGEVEQYIEEGFIKGAWSDDDIAFLKKNYPTKGRKYCSTQLNRNESSVQKKINALGIKKKKKRK
jgi:hypothetical protein